MFEYVIVPLDGSSASLRALAPAVKVAAALDSPLHLVTFAEVGPGAEAIREHHAAQLASIAEHAQVHSEIHVEQSTADTPTGWLEGWLDEWPGALVCMATHGRGRSAAVLGSVATDVIRHRAGPVLLVGPEARPEWFEVGAQMLVPLDGTRDAEQIMPIAEAWAIVFHNEIELMQVLPRQQPRLPPDTIETIPETGYLHRIASKVTVALGREPAYDTFHDEHPSRAIVARAEQTGAGIIAMTTHGLVGTARLLHGSVMAEVTHRSPCPVLTVRPPTLR